MKERTFSQTVNWLLLAVVCVLSLIVLPQFFPVHHQGASLLDGWHYWEGDVRVDVQLPVKLPSKGQESLVLYNDSLTVAQEELSVSTQAAHYRLQASLDGVSLYEFREGSFLRNDQMRSKVNCMFELEDVGEDSVLSMTYHAIPGSRVFDIPAVYIGSADAITMHSVQDNLFTIIIISLMYMLALFSVAVYALLRLRNMQEHRLLDAAGFLFICGTWCLTDSSLVQIFQPTSDIVLCISFFCFMLFAVPVVRFMQHTAAMGKYQVLNYVIAAFYTNFILQAMCNLCFGVDYVHMLFATHILLLGGVLILGFLLRREYVLTKNRELFSFLMAFVLLAFFGVLALALYWGARFPRYQEIYECGILLFIVLLIYRVLITVLENLQARTEMAVQRRLELMDGMTGMKNSSAFLEETAKLSMRKDLAGNTLLAFLDLKRLKYTNDTYGHGAGDELIIAVARCIERSFGAYGTCYRVGGDEFAVIIGDPAPSISELDQILDQEIRQYNQTHKVPISIARGYSHLLDEHGTPKNVSDWKHEADQKLYQDSLKERSPSEDSPSDILRIIDKMQRDE